MTYGTTVPHPAPEHGRPPRPGGTDAGLPRLLPAHGAVPVDLRTHLDRYGAPPYLGQAGRLIPVLKAAGLTGRGGAAFPVHRKLAAVAHAGTRPVVIGNGAEGEPASDKDKSLLWISPHLVLDGLQLAAEAVGSATVGLYLHRHPRLQDRLRSAVAQRAAAGLDQAMVEIIDAPPRFLAGEESALASRVNGGPAMPRFKPPMVFERGVVGRPTLVQNVETLAHLALIARFGAAWFRAAGTAAEPGSMLCTLHQADGRRDVLETGLGTPLHSLLALDGQVQAVLSGGYHGAWLPAADAARMTLSNVDLQPAGAFVGAGVLVALPADCCGIAEAARVARFLALESAGQCGPCFNGLPRIAAAMDEIARPRPDPRAVTDMFRWAALVQGRGACHHPDGSVRFIRSALHVFRDEITNHGQGRCVDPARRPFLPLPAGTALSAADWS
ncbi:MAG TPA: NADH-ubiquinone oxidoreductase-F iron-sulfur binding region domain-containing protein [Streptosporangiaceae bacterium]|nr:NADH-ubiquinone oxidoreductase-F iron-sulfur binding region domain-containing protein [Streptosporangiaceae bacterium]